MTLYTIHSYIIYIMCNPTNSSTYSTCSARFESLVGSSYKVVPRMDRIQSDAKRRPDFTINFSTLFRFLIIATANHGKVSLFLNNHLLDFARSCFVCWVLDLYDSFDTSVAFDCCVWLVWKQSKSIHWNVASTTTAFPLLLLFLF